MCLWSQGLGLAGETHSIPQTAEYSLPQVPGSVGIKKPVLPSPTPLLSPLCD
ncbi:mCG148347 [Mus musculus]|nr:mCG148347 [Mus musculus]